LARVRYSLLPPERVIAGITIQPIGSQLYSFEARAKSLAESGIKELACGSQAFIATLLFDPSMSALPIIVKQNSPSVGLFTH
jgi:hypothetical protein